MASSTSGTGTPPSFHFNYKSPASPGISDVSTGKPQTSARASSTGPHAPPGSEASLLGLRHVTHAEQKKTVRHLSFFLFA